LLIAAPLWVWWAVWKGGYPAAVFLPGVVYLALAAVVLHAFVPRPRLKGPAAWALVALAALTAWSLASLLWADDKGAAEIATARQALFLGSFALPLLWPPSRRGLTVGLASLPALALAGGASGLAAALADAGRLLDGRLVDPTGYANATAALMAIGILPALVLASRRELPAALRIAAMIAAGPLLGIFVLTQSRGGVAALALVVALAILLIPGRLRLLIPVALVALAVSFALDPLLDVRAAAVGDGDSAAALDSAARALIAMTVALGLVAGAYVLADTRLRISAATVRRASVASGLALLAAVVAAAAAIALSGVDPDGWVSDRVEDFKTPDYSRLESERTRFTGDLGSNRYDYWRVSADVFAERPLLGSGSGNFIAPFLERRRANKATIYAHSLWLGALAQMGAIGFLALAGFLAALLLALVRVARSLGAQRWLVVSAALPFAYVVIHASADWIDAFPAVVAPAFALVAAAAGLRSTTRIPAGRGGRSGSLWLTLALAAAALAALPLLVSARLSDRGATTWAQRPAGAISDLERAAELDPLAAAPYVRLGIVAVDLARPALQRRAFESALERDPSAWYPDFQLGLLAASEGRRRSAIARLSIAAVRNPREPEVQRALEAVRAGRGFDAGGAQARILEPTEK